MRILAIPLTGTVTAPSRSNGQVSVRATKNVAGSSQLLRRGRGSPVSRQAFDARQLRLSEGDGAPDILWHTPSLLQVVVAAVRSNPLRRDGSMNLQRLVDVTSALGALGCRGLDPDQLVRRGLAKTVKLGLAGWLEGLDSSENNPLSNSEGATHWRSFFEESAAGPASSGRYIRAALNGKIAERLDEWINSAPLQDVLLRRPLSTLQEASSIGPADEEVEIWTWIVERFTQTYLERWSLASLKREYMFVRGSWRPDFAAELLAERTVKLEVVATALADRSLVSDDIVEPSTMISFVEQAYTLVNDGQRTAAAALFDAARMLKPADVTAQNNYAFCILVDNPSTARSLFKDVLARGPIDPQVTRCNLALAESLLENTEAALEACEQAYRSGDDHRLAYLWQRRDEEWCVVHTEIRSWIAHLGTELEQSAETPDSIWAGRLAHVTMIESQELS
jgi:hypothetical protein